MPSFILIQHNEFAIVAHRTSSFNATSRRTPIRPAIRNYVGLSGKKQGIEPGFPKSLTEFSVGCGYYPTLYRKRKGSGRSSELTSGRPIHFDLAVKLRRAAWPTSKGAKHGGRGVAGYPRCDRSGRVGRFFSPPHSEARKKPLPRDPALELPS